MDCERFERVVLDLLYDELDELTGAAARRHLEHCARCQGIVAGLRATREVGALPLVDPPDGLELRILEAERKAREGLPIGKRLGRAVSVLAGYAMRPQLAMAAILMLAIGGSLVFLRAHPGDREHVQVTERGAPEGESEAVAILPVPTAETEPAPAAAPKAMGSVAQAQKEEGPKLGVIEGTTGPSDSEGDSAFDSARTAFDEGRFGEARKQFDEVAARGGAQAAEAAFRSALSAKKGESCAVAVSLFDQVATRYPGTRFGYDATWESANCYEGIGNSERARAGYQALLDEPSYGDRARSALAQLDRAEQPVEVAARKARAASQAPAAAPPPAKAGAGEAKPGTGSNAGVKADAVQQQNAAESR